MTKRFTIEATVEFVHRCVFTVGAETEEEAERYVERNPDAYDEIDHNAQSSSVAFVESIKEMPAEEGTAT